MQRVAIVGGGSAGHVLPAIPVIEALAAQGCQVLFIGTRSGLEEGLVADAPCEFMSVSAGKLRRYISLENVADLFRILAGIFQAIGILRKFRADVVFSKGGFVSFPVAFAAWLLRIPIVAHESDLTTGLANRLVLPFAKTLCTSFDDTSAEANGLKVVHTGTPLRQAITGGEPSEGRKRLNIPSDEALIVVTGGSLGADGLNRAIIASLVELTSIGHVFHVCGKDKMSGTQQPRYTEVEYVSDGWGHILAAADVVISRAGANALFELVALNKKNVLVPLPKRASRGDQIDNAAHAEKKGWSIVLNEEELSPVILTDAIRELLDNGDHYVANMRAEPNPNSTNAIVTEIHDVAR